MAIDTLGVDYVVDQMPIENAPPYFWADDMRLRALPGYAIGLIACLLPLSSSSEDTKCTLLGCNVDQNWKEQ